MTKANECMQNFFSCLKDAKSTMAEKAWQPEYEIAQHTGKVADRKCSHSAHFLSFPVPSLILNLLN